MKRTKQNIRYIVQCALKSEFGFAPAMSNITLHDSSMDGTYVVFSVNDKKYIFDSYEVDAGGTKTVYVGPGTIRRW